MLKLRPLRSVTREQAFMWTDTPHEAVWDHLRVLQQPSAMRSILVSQRGAREVNDVFEGALADERSKQISYLLVQADEYFRAADAVTLSTKPLPLYYGILSLSKALILAWKREVGLDDLRYHGLDRRPRNSALKAYQNDASAWSLGAEFASVNAGVFSELFRLVHDEDLPSAGIARFDDLLRTDAEISSAYNRLHGFHSLTYPLYDIRVKDDPYEIAFYPTTINKAEFISIFDCMIGDFAVADEIRDEQALVVKSVPEVKVWPRYLGVQRPSAGGRYLVGPVRVETEKGSVSQFISREVADFASMFILSSLVRYKIEFWIDIVRGDARGNVGIVNLHLNSCRRRFPHFVLNGLYGEHFGFGAQARMG